MTATSTISTRARPRLLAGLAAAAAPLFLRNTSSRAAEQPDIIILLTSDVRAGDEIALPQALERIADNGTTFPNFFLTTTLCCPSRASIFTGLYSHNHGVHDNRDGWGGFAKRGNRGRTTRVLLQAAGYRTASIGTYLNGSQPGRGKEPGWDIRPVAGGRKKKHKLGNRGVKANKRKRHRNKGGSGRSDAQLVDAASSIIAETAANQPLYLHVGFGTAHVPVKPRPPYAGQFADAQIDRDSSFNEENVGDKPKYIRDLRRLRPGDEAWLDRLHQGRLEELLALDDGIVEIWDALEARGRLDNTYVFLLSDNAMSLGHHRIYGKMVPYDTSVRAPFFAFGPEFAAGVVDERLVGNIDIAPTLVDLAGTDAPSMDGRSLLDPQERDAILLELLGTDLHSMNWPGPRADIPRFSALRTPTHLYTEYRTGERELYDYISDPFEVENLLAGVPAPEVEQLRAQLAFRLNQLRQCDREGCY
jgi:N-acetylglucosamine-6-sulfatase